MKNYQMKISHYDKLLNYELIVLALLNFLFFYT